MGGDQFPVHPERGRPGRESEDERAFGRGLERIDTFYDIVGYVGTRGKVVVAVLFKRGVGMGQGKRSAGRASGDGLKVGRDLPDDETHSYE